MFLSDLCFKNATQGIFQIGVLFIRPNNFDVLFYFNENQTGLIVFRMNCVILKQITLFINDF